MEWRDKIINEYRRGGTEAALIVDETREGRLRWLGHVLRREVRLVKEM